MKTSLSIVLFLAIGALALPSRERNANQWQKAKPIPPSLLVSPNFRINPLSPDVLPLSAAQTPVSLSPTPAQSSSTCGIENTDASNSLRNGRIVGGSEAAPNQFPWLAFVSCLRSDIRIIPSLLGRGFSCTGSFIADNWVLTAGHCVYGCLEFNIYAGAHDLRDVGRPGDNTIVINVPEDGNPHPNYAPRTLRNDIALIKLPEAVPLDDPKRISLSCLPPRDLNNENLVGALTTITGWGKLSDSSNGVANKPNFLRDIPVISKRDCQRVYGSLTVNDYTICTLPVVGEGVCNGDSGGPLNLNPSAPGEPFIQIGVASFVNIAGCESGSPNGFANVPFFLDYIRDNTGLQV